MHDGPPTTWRKSSYSGGEGGQCLELANLDSSVGVRDSTDPHGHVLHMGRVVPAGLLDHIKTGSLDHPSEARTDMSSTTWRESSYTGQEGGTCVELADLGNTVGVRDSTDPGGPVLRFGRGAVAGLLGRIKSGELDR